jgi:hypothetical protein
MARMQIIDGYGKLRQRLSGVVDDPDDPQFRYRFLADGDSWFSTGYTFPIDNLLKHLAFAADTVALSIAKPGRNLADCVREGLDGSFGRFTGARFGSRWDAILLSLSGHDLIGAESGLLRQEAGQGSAAEYVDASAFDRFLATIQDGFAKLFAMIDRPDGSCAGAPVFVHTYDDIVPRDSPLRVFPGGPALGAAWMKPDYDRKGIRPAMQPEIVKFLLRGLAARLQTIAAGPLGKFGGRQRFFVVATQGTLLPADPDEHGASVDWENEIHPSPAGYAKLAARYTAAVASSLGL